MKQRFTSGLEKAAMAWSISTARSMLPAAGRMAAMAGAGAMYSWKFVPTLNTLATFRHHSRYIAEDGGEGRAE